MAGGVALNSVANGKILKSELFKKIWIQPAAGDAGGALGAAYLGWYIWKDNERVLNNDLDSMKGAYLGPEFDKNEILGTIRKYNANYKYFKNFNELTELIAKKLSKGKVVGWFQGRMEFGPRALGNRSILGDARNPEMQKKMNLKIKYREGFRPFAPSVLEEDISEYFDINCASEYMLHVVPIKKELMKSLPDDYNDMDLYSRLYHLRSDLPAITHVDYSSRLQSVSKNTNPKYWNLICEFKKQTSYGIIINTSFNVRGEPIVCTPNDGFRCFMRTEMDYLVIGNFLFDKSQQTDLINDSDWKKEFKLD